MFSRFVENKDYHASLIFDCVEVIKEQLKESERLFPVKLLDRGFKNMDQVTERFYRKFSEEDKDSFCEKADNMIEKDFRLLYHLLLRYNEERFLIPIPGSYPFKGSGHRGGLSGVHLACQLYAAWEEKPIMLGKTESASKKYSGSFGWLTTQLGVFSEQFRKEFRTRPHAEMLWAAQYANKLIQYVKEHLDNFSKLPVLDDENVFLQLCQPTRLEFVISSSCCEEYCQPLFKQLRNELNNLEGEKINLPIIIYTNQPYAHSGERPASIYGIDSEGDYQYTGLSSDAPALKQPIRAIEAQAVHQDGDYHYEKVMRLMSLSAVSDAVLIIGLISIMVHCKLLASWGYDFQAQKELLSEMLRATLSILSPNRKIPSEAIDTFLEYFLVEADKGFQLK